MNRIRTRWERLLWIALRVALLIGLLGTPAFAHIYQWLDDKGDRHFANSLDRVPEEARDKAEVVVNSPPKTAADEPPAAGAPSEDQANDQGEGQDPFVSGFDAGWEAAMRARDEEPPVCPRNRK